jgi:GAF domain-containing protein
VEQALKLVPGTSLAAITLIDLDRQWFKAIVGSDVEQTPRSQSICAHTIQTNGVLIVNDTTKDARFASLEIVAGPPGIRFYAGIKLTRAVGALCVMGRQPRQISGTEIGKLAQLAQFVDIQLLTGGTLCNLDAPTIRVG